MNVQFLDAVPGHLMAFEDNKTPFFLHIWLRIDSCPAHFQASTKNSRDNINVHNRRATHILRVHQDVASHDASWRTEGQSAFYYRTLCS